MALIATTALLALAGGVIGLSPDPGPGLLPTIPPEPAPEPRADGGFFGVSPQTDLTDKDFRRMRNGGVEVVRTPLSWNAVQAEPGECQATEPIGVCNWSHYDSVIGAAAKFGVRVLPTLGGRAEFTEDRNSDKFIREHPPISGEGLVMWRAFVRAAAARYGPGGAFWRHYEETTGRAPQPIVEWQVWNEPNAGAYWPPRPRASKYAKLVRETTTSIREADADAEIVLGGMFGTATKSSRKYLRKLYAVHGIADHFDSIAIHPYAPRIQGVKVQARWVRDVAKEAGDPEVGLWVTELGWGSGRSGHPLERSPKRQAKLLGRSFKLFLERRDQWNVEGVTWFTWADSNHRKICRFCRHAGLFDGRKRAKPSWDAYKRIARENAR